MQKAFSLVELSIVLVILGLLTGGILAGQSLIRAAELRSVVTDFQRYQTVSQTFRDKYLALPGDMPNATAFWGSMTNCGAASPSGSGTQTCNGNGDGILDSPSAASRTGEIFNFWQQLANASLIGGTYSGIAGSTANNTSLIGTNVPASRVSNAGFTAANRQNYVGDGTFSAMDYGNLFVFGANVANGWSNGIVLTPEETWSIDIKLDDGKPHQGRAIATHWDLCTNATSTADLSSDYDLDYSSKACALVLRHIL